MLTPSFGTASTTAAAIFLAVRATAATVDRLGLPEYYAMEAYVVRKGGEPIETPTVPTSALGWPEEPPGDEGPGIPAPAARETI